MPIIDASVRALFGALIAFLILVVLPGDVFGQMFSYGDRPRSVQSVSFAYKMIDFNAEGDVEENRDFEFDGPAYGVLYTRPSLVASLTYGPETGTTSRELRLLDAAVTTWGEIVLTRSPNSSRLYVPIAIHTNYRRVAPQGSEDSLVDSFNLTVLGLGTGVGISSDLLRSVRLEAKAMPIIGIAIRAFGDSAGSSFLFDTDVRLHLLDLIEPVGITLSYAFRTQAWNVSGSDFLLESDDVLDYSGMQHLFTVGFNW